MARRWPQASLSTTPVRCPWHHACFSLRTGEALRAPALDPVTCWKVETHDGKLFVRDKEPEKKPMLIQMMWTSPNQVAEISARADAPRQPFSKEKPYPNPNLMLFHERLHVNLGTCCSPAIYHKAFERDFWPARRGCYRRSDTLPRSDSFDETLRYLDRRPIGCYFGRRNLRRQIVGPFNAGSSGAVMARGLSAGSSPDPVESLTGM